MARAASCSEANRLDTSRPALPIRPHCPIRVLRSGTGSLPKPLVFSFGGLGSGLAEQVARDVDQGEPSSFFWQFVGVGFAGPGSESKGFREFCDQARGVVSDAPPDWQEVRGGCADRKRRRGSKSENNA